jgi:pimeloyl-ACP methyl ester carboxylesterase
MVAHLTPRWQRFVISGVAPSDFPVASQGLTIQLGKAQTEVSLGPVMFTPGKADKTLIKAAFAGLRAAWVSEDVSIKSSSGVVLAGTLRTPNGHGSGPFPAVLLLGGSGPGWRGGPTPLMRRLLGDGIAVLEYDKRGNGQSSGEFVDSLENMETDAASAVKYLRTRADIDGNRIALVGHSQGGAVAPAVAARDAAIAGVVMLAGPVVPATAPAPGHEINLVIMKDMLAKAGATPAAVAQVSQASERLFEAEVRNATPNEIAPLREAAIRGFIACDFQRAQAEGALATVNAIVLEAMNTHFDQTLASLRAPVLALYASEDEHASTPSNLPAAKAALAGNPDAKVIEVADLNHGFRHVKNVSALEKGYPGPIGAPEAIRLVGDWLDAHLHPANPTTTSLN